MSREHRASLRFSLPEGQDRALVRLGWKNLPVQILNVSATGFLLACPEVDVQKNQLLWIRTTAAWIRVRVVFLKSVGAEMHLGVERLDELEEPAELTSSWLPFTWLAPAQSTAGSLGNLAVAIGVLAMIVAGALALNQEWTRSTSAPPRRHLSHTLAGYERDLEHAWSEAWTAARRFLPGFTSRGKSPDPTTNAAASVEPAKVLTTPTSHSPDKPLKTLSPAPDKSAAKKR